MSNTRGWGFICSVHMMQEWYTLCMLISNVCLYPMYAYILCMLINIFALRKLQLLHIAKFNVVTHYSL